MSEFPKDDINDATHRVLGEGEQSEGTTPGRYDHLFDPVVDPKITQEDIDKWPQLNEWQQRLFAPVVEEKPTPSTPANFDFLFDDSVAPPPPYVPGVSHSKPENVRMPTPESVAQAEEFLAANGPFMDPAVKQIIELVTSTPAESPAAMIEAARTSGEVRRALARYFLSKMSMPEAPHNSAGVRFWPEQIIHNSNKESRFGGYPRDIRSKDYAILITLAVLDGSFKHGRAGSDRAVIREKEHNDYYSEKYIDVGHHRGTAALLLGLEPGVIN